MKVYDAKQGVTTGTTGFKKHTGGKLQIHCLHPLWIALLGRHMAYGAYEKVLPDGAKGYGYGNWIKGGDTTTYGDAMLRHVTDWVAGNDADPKDGSDILVAIACNALMAKTNQLMGRLVDKRNEMFGDVSISVKEILYGKSEESK